MAPPDLEIIKGSDFSDGDATHRPDPEMYIPVDPKPLLQVIAFKWVVENLGDAQHKKLDRNGYVLDKFPAGYAAYGRSRPNKRVDKYIYGHPNHRVFNSIEQFYTHFRYLMLHKDGDTCECHLCAMGEKRKGGQASTVGVRRRAPKVKASSPVTLLALSKHLQETGRPDWKIEERQNMDWRGENEIVAEGLDLVSKQHSFVPRVGEMVLWCDKIDGEIHQVPTGEFRIFPLGTEALTDYPQWIAGVVAEVPILSQPISFEDIKRETQKEYTVSSSGFRIQWYHGPNAINKDFSNRYGYVPMHHVRPLAFWKEYMAGIPKENWHPTIKNCLEAMGAISPIHRSRLNSEASVTKIYDEGYFLGAEALFAGDIVRLSPDGKPNITQVLKIDAIVTSIEKIETSEGNSLPGENNHSISVKFRGSAFTNEPTRSQSSIPIDPTTLDTVMNGYGPWYSVGHPNDIAIVGHSEIIGRLFEKRSMDLWAPLCRTTALDMGCMGVLEAREYSKTHDSRLKPGEGFYVADDRVSALNLRIFNGQDVGGPDPNLDPRLQQEFFAVLDGSEKEEDHSQVEAVHEGGHSQAKAENAEEHSQPDLTTSALSQDSEDSSKGSQQDTAGFMEHGTATWNKKRAHLTSSSSDELQGPPSARKRSNNMDL